MPSRSGRPTGSIPGAVGLAVTLGLTVLTLATGSIASSSRASTDLSSRASAGQPAVRVAPPVPPRPRVLTIGDSAHAGIERNGAFAALRGASFEVRGESCRRLVRPSCDLRGTGAPPTALETLRSTPLDAFDVVVLHVGHNDQMPAFGDHAVQIYQAAKAAGIDIVIWLTQSPELRSDLGGAPAFQVYERHNAVIRFLASTRPDVHVVEWSSMVRQRSQYAYPDGIHLRQLGGFAVADAISRAVAHVTFRPCPMPETPAAQPPDPCPDPNDRPPVDVAALYDLGTRIIPCATEGPRRETVCRWDVG